MSFMTNEIPARHRSRTPTLPSIRPREKWSGISQLPPEDTLAIEIVRNTEIAAALSEPDEVFHHDHTTRMASALDRLKNIDPQDAVESMLATFMLQTQALATRAARAASADFDFSGAQSFSVDRYLRLSMAFMKQMEALAKYRNKGAQELPTEPAHASDSD